MASQDYQNLLKISRHGKVLEGIYSLLHWDQETYMPSAAATIRAEQLATMAELTHKERTSSKFAKALSKMIDLETGHIHIQGLTPAQTASVHEWHRSYRRAIALPAQFVKEFAQLTSQAIEAWKHAKQHASFHHFAPFLDQIINKSREKAALIGYAEHPYDALLDEFEPHTTTKEISKLFSGLGKEVSSFLKKITNAKALDDSCLYGKFSTQKQLKFSQMLLHDMGYDMSKGRLDLSTHPFSSSCHPTDSRITTRIHPSSLMSCISVALHEGGHSLYEMGLPVEEYGSPLCEAISLGIHESQSRWWETRIGQNKSFWQHYFPLLKKTFKGKLEKSSLNDFYRAINKVSPSFIRVEADEVTYSLHVIIRFEIERALIEGSLNVRDIPEAWNAKMKQYLGIIPKNDAEGCLQDIHWSLGCFGYFPTYTLGNLYAAQIFETFEKDIPDWEKRLTKGELDFVREWLHRAVHCHGKRYTSKELIYHITGKKFSEKPFIHYLHRKYSEIYCLAIS